MRPFEDRMRRGERVAGVTPSATHLLQLSNGMARPTTCHSHELLLWSFVTWKTHPLSAWIGEPDWETSIQSAISSSTSPRRRSLRTIVWCTIGIMGMTKRRCWLIISWDEFSRQIAISQSSTHLSEDFIVFIWLGIEKYGSDVPASSFTALYEVFSVAFKGHWNWEIFCRDVGQRESGHDWARVCSVLFCFIQSVLAQDRVKILTLAKLFYQSSLSLRQVLVPLGQMAYCYCSKHVRWKLGRSQFYATRALYLNRHYSSASDVEHQPHR